MYLTTQYHTNTTDGHVSMRAEEKEVLTHHTQSWVLQSCLGRRF